MLSYLILIISALSLAQSALAFQDVIPDIKSIHHSFVFAYNPKGPLITSFKTTFVIPPMPKTKSQQSIALWPGLQTEDSGQVLQPVAQWGEWSNGSGESWFLSTWAVVYPQGGRTAKFNSSPRVPVAPGTVVTAVIEFVSQINGVYTYRGYFENIPGTETIHRMNERFNSLFLEYEMQTPKICSDYSGEVVFSKVQVYAGTTKLNLAWNSKVEDPLKCGIKVRTNRLNDGGYVRLGIL